jgi:hypothetical protein
LRAIARKQLLNSPDFKKLVKDLEGCTDGRIDRAVCEMHQK